VSVYTGEMLAILLAVQWIEEVRPLRTRFGINFSQFTEQSFR